MNTPEGYMHWKNEWEDLVNHAPAYVQRTYHWRDIELGDYDEEKLMFKKQAGLLSPDTFVFLDSKVAS